MAQSPGPAVGEANDRLRLAWVFASGTRRVAGGQHERQHNLADGIKPLTYNDLSGGTRVAPDLVYGVLTPGVPPGTSTEAFNG
jgi:hypothetical protein